MSTLAKAFNVQQKEKLPVGLLLVHSFFIGIFLSYYITYASSAFLSSYAGLTYLSYTYLLAGFAGFIASSVFSSLQTKIPYARLAMGTLWFLLGLTFLFILGIETLVGDFQKQLSFLTYSFVIPVATLLILQFWGMTMKLFDTRQGKRLFGLISSGEVISSILGYLSVPIILKTLGVEKEFLMYLATIGLLVGIFFQYIIIKKFPKELSQVAKKKEKPKIEKAKKTKWKGGLLAIFKNKFFTLIFILFFVSTLGRIFVDYVFLGAVKVQKDLTSFFGLFFALIKVITLLFNTLLTARLLSKYGVRLGLVMLPILLTMFIVVAFLAMPGWEEGTKAPMLLFLALCMTKLCDKVVRNALESPAFKTLYTPLNPDTKLMVQSQVEGKGYQIGVFCAGGVLIILNMIAPTKTIIISMFIISGILVIWLILARKTIKAYRDVVIDKLTNFAKKGETNKKLQHQDIISKGVSSNNEQIVITTFKYLQRISPFDILTHLNYLLNSVHTPIRKAALAFVSQHQLKEKQGILEQQVLKEKENNLKTSFSKTIQELRELEHIKLNKATNWMINNKKKNRLIYANLLNKIPVNDALLLSEKLLKDKKPAVVLAAINFMVGQKSILFYKLLIDNLHQPYIGRVAFPALTKANSEIIPLLRNAFLKYESDQFDREVAHIAQLKIIRILYQIGTTKAKDLLAEKLTNPNIEIRSFTIRALIDLNYQVPPDKRLYIKQLIQEETNFCAWLLAADLDLEKRTEAAALSQILKEQYLDTRNNVFGLLSFIYEAEAVNQILTNIESNIKERTVLAIEMTDILLEEDFKEIVFPLIDQVSDTVQLKQLQEMFPQQRLAYLDRLRNIISYDFARVNAWTKLITIKLLTALSKTTPQDILANIYNPNWALKEAAYITLFTLEEAKYYRYLAKEKEKTQLSLNKVVGVISNKMRANSVLGYTEQLAKITVFQNIPKPILLKIATRCKTLVLEKNETLRPSKKYKNSVFLVIEGEVSVFYNRKNQTTSYKSGDIIGIDKKLDFRENDKITGATNVYFYYLDEDIFFNYIQIHPKLAEQLYKYFSNILKKEEAPKAKATV